MDSTSNSSKLWLPSHRPRKIWEVMTPELPRAPMRAPVVMALRISAPRAPMGRFATLLTTDWMRERHVRAGVAVGHREHVQAVHFLLALVENLG